LHYHWLRRNRLLLPH